MTIKPMLLSAARMETIVRNSLKPWWHEPQNPSAERKELLQHIAAQDEQIAELTTNLRISMNGLGMLKEAIVPGMSDHKVSMCGVLIEQLKGQSQKVLLSNSTSLLSPKEGHKELRAVLILFEAKVYDANETMQRFYHLHRLNKADVVSEIIERWDTDSDVDNSAELIPEVYAAIGMPPKEELT